MPHHTKIVLCAVLLIGSALTATTSAQKARAQKWKMATSWPGGPLMDHGAKAFAERVELLTDGRIRIQVFAAGVLGKPLKVSDTVRAGVAQCGHTWIGYDWGKDRTAVLFGGYAGSFNTEVMLHWLYEGGGAELWAQWRQENFKLVSRPLYTRTAEVFLHSHKRVETLEDLQGLKIRTVGAWLEIAKQLGASPLASAGGEVYPMLDRKVIDATEWGTLWENVSPGFHRITRYVIVPGVHQPTAPFELVINGRAWKKLTPRDRKLVDLAAKMVTLESWLKVGHEDIGAYHFFRDQGNEIVVLSPEAQLKVKQLGIEWAQRQAEGNDWFRKVFDHQRAYEERWKDAPAFRNPVTEP